MTELDLAAIRARHTAAVDSHDSGAAYLSALDMPALLGRIAELEGERNAARDLLAAARQDPDWDPGAMVMLYDGVVDERDNLRAIATVRERMFEELRADRDLWRERCDGEAWERTEREKARLRKDLELNKAGWAAEIERLHAVEAERDKAVRQRDSLARRCAVRFEETEKARAEVEAMRPVVEAAKAAVRAAAPHIRRAVLLETADELLVESNRVRRGADEDSYNWSVSVGVLGASRMVRERAEREVGT